MMTMHLISASAAFWSPTQATPSATAIGPTFGELDFQAERIARLCHSAELGLVDAGVYRGLAAELRHGKQRHAAALRKRFQAEHCRHDRVAREVALKEELIPGQMQRADHMLLVHFEDLVHQQHGRTVREDLHDLFFIQHISYTSFSSSASDFINLMLFYSR